MMGHVVVQLVGAMRYMPEGCRFNSLIVIEIFHLHNPSGHAMALGLTQPLTEMSKGKGKAVPLQAWSGPEGSRKLLFPDFMSVAQDGGQVVSLMHRPPLPPGNTPGTHFC